MKNVGQLKTTLIGLVALILPILVIIGWVSPEKSGPLGEQLPLVIESAFAFVAALAGLWAIFKTNDDG